MGDSITYVLQSSMSSPSSSAVVQAGTLPKFLDQWRIITSNRFVLSMIKSHHLQLMWHLPLFHHFIWFNIRVAVTHHPVIPNKVGELLAKGAIGAWTGGSRFYLNVFMVPKHNGSL